MFRKIYMPAAFIKIAAFILLFLLTTSCLFKKESRSVSTEERDYFINYLKDNLSKAKNNTESIHLAEFLTDLHYGKEVYEILSGIDLTHDSINSSVKCITYRALALAAQNPEDKKLWISRINDILESGNEQDQIIAAESLAKIRSAPSSDTIRNRLNTTKNLRLKTFLQWSYAFESKQKMQETTTLFLTNCTDPNVNPEVRRLSAYALGYSFELSHPQQIRMQEIAADGSTNTVLQKYLVWGTYIVSKNQKNNNSAFSNIEKKTIALAHSEIAADRYLMATAMAGNGRIEDISLLKTAFSQELKTGRNQDVLFALAYAILKIDRNEPYTLSKLDWIVVALYLIMMVLVGVYYSKRNKSAKDFVLGGKNMSSFSIGLSLFATMLSSLSYLSYPGEMIRYGPIIFAGMFAFPITHWVIGWYIIPKFMKEDVSSAYELLEKKLGLSIRLLASFFFISLRFMWMATIIYVTVNTAVGAIFKVTPLQSIIFCTVLVIITLIYSSLGGLKAVVMTDVIQTFLLWIGALLTIVIISIKLGSFFSWFPDHWLGHWSPLKWGFDATERLTVGNAMLLLFVMYLCTAGSDQMTIQRYLATKDLQAARRSFGISLLSNLLVKILLGLVGLTLLAYFFKNPHLLIGEKDILEQADSFFPRFIVVGFPIGIAGVVFAGLLAAAMSSLSSGMNSTATVISEDWLKRFEKNKKSAENELKRIKVLSALVGTVVLILSFGVGYIHGNLFDIIQKTANLFVAPLFVLFFMALFVPFSTERGTFIAGVSSVIFAMGVAYYEFMGIKSLWIMSASLIFGIVVGVVASYIDLLIHKPNSKK